MNKRTRAAKKKAAQEETPRSISQWLYLVSVFFVFYFYIFLCEAGL